MSVSLGVVSPKSKTITSLDNWNESDSMIVISGTTAETYLTKNYPNIKLQKYDAYAQAKTALENGSGAAWANDNTPAVTKGNDTLLNWINDEIKALGKENFFHKDYEATLLDTYGKDYENQLVIEGGELASSTNDTAK